jgi:class 3 adenylate cyclase
MDLPMKSLVQSAIRFCQKGIATGRVAVTENPIPILESGYSFDGAVSHQRQPTRNLVRRTVGILYADIAEYARLTEEDEEGTHFRLIESKKIMKNHILANGGLVANSAGDAMLAKFKDTDSALRCAINVQLAARQWNATLNPRQQLQFRMGVNFGDVISEQGDIFGSAVNITARLENLACSGGICISKSARSSLRNQARFKFIDLGKRQVKSINEPVHAFRIEIAPEVVDPWFTSAVKISAVIS